MNLSKLVIFSLVFTAALFLVNSAFAQTFPQKLYSSYGFPAPDSPKQMGEDTLFRWNNYLKPYAEKAAKAVGVDVGFIGMWPWLESQITTLDNCGDSDHDPNTYCNWNDTLWQVGWGVFPEWESVYLKEAIAVMRPGESLQQIGQRVISNSQELKPGGRRCPKDSWYENVVCKPHDASYRFPNTTSVDDLVNKGRNGDLEAQKQVAILMKDDAIGAYILAKKFKSYVDNNNNKKVADLMAGWPPYTPYQPQNVINYIAGIYAADTNSITPSSSRYRTTSNVVRTRVGSGIGAVPDIMGDPRKAVINQFNVNLSADFPKEYYNWAWELLWRVSDTSFDERVNGTVVGRDDSGSHQIGCKEIAIRGTYNQELFNVVFTHEMGHIIRNCTDNNYADRHNQTRAKEGQLTIYSRLLCTYSGNYGEWQKESENYAEMIAYYLNPNVDSQTACGREPNPYANGAHNEHYQVAQLIMNELPSGEAVK